MTGRPVFGSLSPSLAAASTEKRCVTCRWAAVRNMQPSGCVVYADNGAGKCSAYERARVPL